MYHQLISDFIKQDYKKDYVLVIFRNFFLSMLRFYQQDHALYESSVSLSPFSFLTQSKHLQKKFSDFVKIKY